MERQTMIKIVEREIEMAASVLSKWQSEFAADPFYAFRWSDDAMETAAKLNVLKAVQKSLGDDTEPVERLQSKLQRAVMSKAKSPKHSTSPSQNVCEQYEMAAMAWILEKIFED